MTSKSLQYDNQRIPYEIRHKPGVTRRIHLRITAEGDLLVVVPKRMSKRAVHKMLQERSHKVVRFLDHALARQRELLPCDYVHGEEQLYLGEIYPLEIVASTGRGGSVALDKGRIRIETADSGPPVIRRKLIAWYRQQAQRHFNARIEAISRNAPWIEGQAPAMRLRKMKRTWGSCSASGVITLNPRLIKAPPASIDYVVAHELCHLQEMNHGKAFYDLLGALYPQWSETRAHLRANSHIYLHD
jgi:predicted metal-dependent hydrolase